MTRLGQDVRGNTLAIMAAALVPIIGFAGSAVDVGRLYVVRVRLQQACDAGALAGRKAMTDTRMATPLEPEATSQAQSFFNNNFRTGWFQTGNVTFTTAKASIQTSSDVANGVTGTATATVPMALMYFFGIKQKQITVGCQAVFDVPDADIMFVLDTTGSMSCYPGDPANCNNGDPQTYTRADGTTDYYIPEKSPRTDNGVTTYSRLESLRQSVTLFDNTVRGSADDNTHIRYGFVTYASAVNVGRLIPSQYLQDKWTYRSRHLSPLTGDGGVLAGDYASGGPNSTSMTNVPKSMCVEQRYPATGFSKSGPTWNSWTPQARRYYNLSWKPDAGGTCSGQEQVLRPYWRYEPVEWPVSDYLRTGQDGNTEQVNDPTRFDGSTSKWRGCVEELNTSTASSFDVNNLPDDLNPDIKPTSSTNKWRPMWPDVEFNRWSGDVKDEHTNDYGEAYNFGSWEARTSGVMCGMPARRLKVMSAQDVHDYVYHNDFRASGGTYHDIGMIWGTRMIAPNGVFGDDTKAWPGRKPPLRSIVFMTDGNLAPDQDIYGQYGVEMLDNRTGGAGSKKRDYANHSARFRVECDAAKQRGITVYTVALGTAMTDDLRYCASPGQAYQAGSTDALKEAFRSIAQRVAMLRIAK